MRASRRSPPRRQRSSLGEEIRAGRLLLGFTQAQFARLLGTTANTVARWDRGEVEPSPSWALRLRVLLRSNGRFVPGADPIRTWHSLWSLSRRYLGAAVTGKVNALEPIDPGAAVPRLLAAARAAGTRVVVMGGLAAIAWGVERLTKDLDAVGVPESALHDFVEAARAEGFLVPKGLAPEPLAGSDFRKVTIYWPLTASAESASVETRNEATAGGAMPVDVMLMDDAFTDSAVVRARPVSTGSGVMPIVSVEDLLLFKLVASRDKDLSDARTLMRLHARELEKRYMKRWARRLGVLDLWEDLQGEYESGAVGL